MKLEHVCAREFRHFLARVSLVSAGSNAVTLVIKRNCSAFPNRKCLSL